MWLGWTGAVYGQTLRCYVTAYNISEEQVKYARQQAEKQGVAGQIEYVLDDYRNIKGQFDVFVSVGMLEHVGKPGYRELGEIIKSCLKPEGRGLIHSIGRIENRPMNAWIERRIFPGACPPALSEAMQIFEPNDLAVYDGKGHFAQMAEGIQRLALRQGFYGKAVFCLERND